MIFAHGEKIYMIDLNVAVHDYHVVFLGDWAGLGTRRLLLFIFESDVTE